MNTIKLLIILASLSSCAIFLPNKKQKEDRVYEFLTNQKVENVTAKKIEEHLSKNVSMSGGDYQITIFPISLPYLIAEARDLKILRGLNDKESTQTIEKWRALYNEDKTCFKMRYQVLLKKEVAKLENWKLNLIDKNGTHYPLKWQKSNAPNHVIVSERQSYTGTIPTYLGEGIACSRASVDLTKGFFIQLEPSFVQWPFPEKKNVLWSFNHYIKKGDHKIFVKKEKKIQKYRGW